MERPAFDEPELPFPCGTATHSGSVKAKQKDGMRANTTRLPLPPIPGAAGAVKHKKRF